MNVFTRTISSILFIGTIYLLGCVSDLPTPSSEETEPVVESTLFEIKIGDVGFTERVFQGQHVSVPITMTGGLIIGGFDLLIGYENAALSIQSATPGKDLTDYGWEYFTYRFGNQGYDCDSSCPTALLRLTAIAETNNGPNHPTKNKVSELLTIDFLVTNDRTYEYMRIPISFFWFDCGDNALTDWNRDSLFVSKKVFNTSIAVYDYVLDTVLFRYDEIQYADTTYPTYFGAQYTICDTSIRSPYEKNVSFYNGSVQLDGFTDRNIDARGDINLNSINNDIGDAVLFVNYFLYGLDVFTINTEGQIASSDVNADGLSLSIADLAYMMRIIYGDAVPYPNIPSAQAELLHHNDTLTVDNEMGTALVIIEGEVTPTLLADNMTMDFVFGGTNTRVIIYSLEGHTFRGYFLVTSGKILSTDLGSAEGAVVSLVPALGQNYPNPFTTLTTIPFYIVHDSDVKIEIKTKYGITKFRHTAHYEAGNNSFEYNGSAQPIGEYSYTFTVDSTSITKTMTIER